MKVLKGIFIFIMSLIMILCIGILACAMTPSLTGMLAEKVENMTSARPGGNGSGLSSTGDSAVEDPASTVQPGINIDWIRDGNQTGYEPPDSQSVEAPASVSGRMGYEPVQEEAQQILPEEADNLAETAPLGNTGSGLSFNAEIYPYYAMLEPEMRSLYNQIYANAMDMVQSFAPVTAVNVNQLKTVFEAVYNDHPELFWLETGYSCKYLRNGSCVEITLKYNATAGNLEAARQEFDRKAEEILSAAEILGSDLEKEQYVHDSLMQSVEYAINAPMNQSAYSALVQGRTVCAGYARAFQYLMQQMGIPCYYCTGFAGEDHAWNIVKLGADYYNVDVTWDDTDTPTYDYFNKSDREFSTSHMRTGLAVYLPACGSGMDLPENPISGNASGTGDGGNSGNATGVSGNQAAGSGVQTGGNSQDSATVLINPNPIEPLRWHSGTETGADRDTDPENGVDVGTGQENGTDEGAEPGIGQENSADAGTEQEPADEEERRQALERAGIDESAVRDTMEEYYEDCGKLLRAVGVGDRQFSNVIPKEMWNSVEQAYNNGDYRKGYVDDALKAMDAESFVILLQAQDIGGGYYRLYHNVYTY